MRMIPTSQHNVDKFKKIYPGLSHVRTGETLDGIIYISDDEKEVIAFLQCNSENGYIQALEVSKDHRRKGIATKLLDVANKEYECHKLSVNKKNTEAIALYEKYGYKTISETDHMLHMEYGAKEVKTSPKYADWKK